MEKSPSYVSVYHFESELVKVGQNKEIKSAATRSAYYVHKAVSIKMLFKGVVNAEYYFGSLKLKLQIFTIGHRSRVITNFLH